MLQAMKLFMKLNIREVTQESRVFKFLFVQQKVERASDSATLVVVISVGRKEKAIQIQTLALLAIE